MKHSVFGTAGFCFAASLVFSATQFAGNGIAQEQTQQAQQPQTSQTPAKSHDRFNCEQVAAAWLSQESVRMYKENVGSCACPSDKFMDDDGIEKVCGPKSAIRQPGGAKPWCTPDMVPKSMFDNFCDAAIGPRQ